MVMMMMTMQLLNQGKFQGKHDYGGQGVDVQGTPSAPNPFNASSLPLGLFEPLHNVLFVQSYTPVVKNAL